MRSANAALEGDGEQFARLHSEFHGELVEDLFGVTVDDQAYGLFFGEAALEAVENLVFSDAGRCGLVFYVGRRVFRLDVRKGVRSAGIRHQQRVALREVPGMARTGSDLDQTTVAVLAVSSGNAFGNDGRMGVGTQVDHFGAGVRLLGVVGDGDGVELSDAAISFEDATWIFPGHCRTSFYLGPADFCPRFTDAAFGDKIEHASLALCVAGGTNSGQCCT